MPMSIAVQSQSQVQRNNSSLAIHQLPPNLTHSLGSCSSVQMFISVYKQMCTGVSTRTQGQTK